jgi:hypothetical protein
MIFEMFIQTQVLGHFYTLHNGHPRTIKIASLGSCFASLEDHQQGLKSAKPRNIHEGIGMP